MATEFNNNTPVQQGEQNDGPLSNISIRDIVFMVLNNWW